MQKNQNCIGVNVLLKQNPKLLDCEELMTQVLKI